nr:Hpt domain-containing protein [Shimia biformata]
MIDWSRVNDLKDEIGEDDFAEVAEIFLEEVDDAIARLPRSTDLAADLHFLKGSALNLGFCDLGTLCQLGESAAAGGAKVDIAAITSAYSLSRQAFVDRLG